MYPHTYEEHTIYGASSVRSRYSNHRWHYDMVQRICTLSTVLLSYNFTNACCWTQQLLHACLLQIYAYNKHYQPLATSFTMTWVHCTTLLLKQVFAHVTMYWMHVNTNWNAKLLPKCFSLKHPLLANCLTQKIFTSYDSFVLSAVLINKNSWFLIDNAHSQACVVL